MGVMTIQQAMDLATQRHQAGQLTEAEGIYRQILATQPDNAEALHRLGVVASQTGQHEKGLELIDRAIAMNPRAAEYYCNRGMALSALGRLEDAVAAYQVALSLRENFPEAHNNLGNVLQKDGKLDLARAHFQKAIVQRPRYAEAHNNLSNALRLIGHYDESLEEAKLALELRPDFAEAHNGVGLTLMAQLRLKEAIVAFGRAVELQPKLAGAWFYLGTTAYLLQRTDEAIAAFNQALLLEPNNVDALNNLGAALSTKGKFDEAIALFRQVLELKGDDVETLGNLSTALHNIGEIDAALVWLNRAIKIAPENPASNDNRLYYLHFHQDSDSPSLFGEHVEWNEKHAKKLGENIAAFENDRSPERQLRIGYVSADFRQHPVGLAIEPLIAKHDRQNFHISCFFNSAAEDEVTARIRGSADAWHSIVGLNDAQLAQLIRDQKIDILVDLSLHMAGNRLLAFARRPAPVQVTYLGYPGTTGLSTMDYRLSDRFLDPAGTDRWYTEKTIRLPRTYLCWRWNGTDEGVGPLPASGRGYITFGSLNNFCKVTPQVLQTWGMLMSQVPESRLILRCPPGETSKRVENAMGDFGVKPDRLELVGRLPWNQYVELYRRQDIGLDPFPYPGHTTSLDALWMGVPVVTLAGKTAASRGGVSILQNLGLGELIANDVEGYMDIAKGLCCDLSRLSSIRVSLRDRVGHSPLMDEVCFARDVESAYRQMWRNWCEGK